MEQAESLKALQAVAEELAAQYLGDYTTALKAGAAERLGRKDINDALWGTVTLSPVEVAVLDSPLFQRLRFLRLMGAAHWVYPGAVHTRFEHAIGTLYQVQQLVDSLNARAAANALNELYGKGLPSELIDKDDAQLLRLGSLFSHVGRLAFSDSAVAELELQSAFATATRDFAMGTKRSEPGADPSFCQLLAHYIVRSGAVREFLLTLVRADKLHLGKRSDESAVDHAVRVMSLAVVGRMFDETRPHLQTLVSGPFDASRLDELVRDAKFSGIPTVLDIRRLVQKLALQPILASMLPPWIGGSLAGLKRHEIVQVFGVPSSAASVLNELQLAEVLVTTKIRRHPKVLAAEQMLRSVIRTFGDLAAPKDFLAFLYSTAEDVLIGHSSATLGTALHRQPENPLTALDQERLASAAGTLAAIRERRVWVRAVQLSDTVYDESTPVGMSLLHDDLRHVQRGPEFLQALRAEVAAVRQAAGLTVIPEAALAAQISLHSLDAIAADTRVGRAIVLAPGKQPFMLDQRWKGSDNWVNLYLRGQPTTYVFSAPELADAVYIAFERLADKKFGAALPSGTAEASKRSKDNLQDLKRLTATAGFWTGHAWRIRPSAPIWDSMEVHQRISQILPKLYKVSTVAADADKPVERREATYRWLLQFETDPHIDGALAMLENLQVLEREVTTAAFKSFFARHKDFEGCYVTAFGDPKDGSVIQGNFAASHTEITKVVTLDQWAREEVDRPLVFIDDFCGTGRQACDILAAWFDQGGQREGLGEERDALTQEVQERLRRTKIAFLFLAAWDAGVDKISAKCKELGLTAIVKAHIPEADIPFAKTALLGPTRTQPEVDDFVQRCTAIGEQLLQSASVAPEKIEDRKFGYGNTGMLMATLLNVPTQTATLIWNSGEVDGTPWEALLPRRKKT